MQHLIRTADFTKEEILEVFNDARMFLDMQSNEVLKGKIVVNLFLKILQELEALLKWQLKGLELR